MKGRSSAAAEPSRVSVGLVTTLLSLLGAYPVAIVLGSSAVVESIDPWALVRITVVSMSSAGVLYVLLGLAIRDARARLQWLTSALLLFSTYGIAVGTVGFLGWARIAPADPRAALAYVAITGAVSTVLVRPWKPKRRDMVPACLIAVLLVGANLYRGAARWWTNPKPQWVSAAESMTYAPVADQNVRTAPAQDIYYILLDELGRRDVLKDRYGLDISSFVERLQSLGFYVPTEARSNYPHTGLSVSSFLNLDYLDAVAHQAGQDFNSREPIEYLIQHNALMRLARNAGYEVVAIGTDVSPEKRYGQADVCVCAQYGLSMFEQAVLAKTPLAAAPFDALTYGAHRRKILTSFDALEEGRASPKRQFVFAHILAAHPPFTFAPDGSFRRPAWPFMLNDGDDFPGTQNQYVAGYRDQVAYVLGRVEAIVRAILSRPGPRPVIIIHGDHGPGSQLALNDPSRTNLHERMSIFAAYDFPGGEARFYPTMTPVNANRLLSNRFLGTHLQRLPDESFFSTRARPFEFIRVGDDALRDAAGRAVRR